MTRCCLHRQSPVSLRMQLISLLIAQTAQTPYIHGALLNLLPNGTFADIDYADADDRSWWNARHSSLPALRLPTADSCMQPPLATMPPAEHCCERQQQQLLPSALLSLSLSHSSLTSYRKRDSARSSLTCVQELDHTRLPKLKLVVCPRLTSSPVHTHSHVGRWMDIGIPHILVKSLILLQSPELAAAAAPLLDRASLARAESMTGCNRVWVSSLSADCAMMSSDAGCRSP